MSEAEWEKILEDAVKATNEAVGHIEIQIYVDTIKDVILMLGGL